MSSTKPTPFCKEVGDWVLEEIIGKGAQAPVYRGHHKVNNRIAAIKEFCLDNFDDASFRQVQQEAELIKSLQHPFVITLIDSFVFQRYFYVVYEFIRRGSLYKVIEEGVFEADVAKRVIREVLTGLNYIHEHGVIHRDIKADNILIDDNNNIKIADFGISLANVNIKGDSSLPPGNEGSSYWMAPERVQMEAPTTKSDIWSVGCLTLELLTGKPPYWNYAPMTAVYHIGYDTEVPIIDPDHRIDEDCRSFLMQCFIRDPEKRPSAKQLKDHPWLSTRKSNVLPSSGSSSGSSSTQQTSTKPNPIVVRPPTGPNPQAVARPQFVPNQTTVRPQFVPNQTTVRPVGPTPPAVRPVAAPNPQAMAGPVAGPTPPAVRPVAPNPQGMARPVAGPTPPVARPVAAPNPQAMPRPQSVPNPQAMARPVAPTQQTMARPQSVPNPQAMARPQSVPNPQAMVRPQSVPNPQAMARPQSVPNPQAMARPVAGPNPQTMARPQSIPPPSTSYKPTSIPPSSQTSTIKPPSKSTTSLVKPPTRSFKPVSTQDILEKDLNFDSMLDDLSGELEKERLQSIDSGTLKSDYHYTTGTLHFPPGSEVTDHSLKPTSSVNSSGLVTPSSSNYNTLNPHRNSIQYNSPTGTMNYSVTPNGTLRQPPQQQYGILGRSNSTSTPTPNGTLRQPPQQQYGILGKSNSTSTPTPNGTLNRPPNSPNGSLNKPLSSASNSLNKPISSSNGSLKNPIYTEYGPSKNPYSSPTGSIEIPSTPNGTWNSSLNTNKSTGNLLKKNMSELINRLITVVDNPTDLTSKDIVNILTDIQTFLSESSACYDYLLSSTATYYIYKLIIINSTNISICLAALKIIHILVENRPDCHTSLILMGYTSLISQFINAYTNIPSAKTKTPPKQQRLSEKASAILNISFDILTAFFQNTSPTLDLLFGNGAVNIALTLLNSPVIKQIKIGCTCLSNLIYNLTNLPIAVICDLLYSAKIIQSLYNAIETCITESTTTSFLFACSLVDMLLLFLKQNNPLYTNSIINNNQLNTILFTLTYKPDNLKEDKKEKDLLASDCLERFIAVLLKLIIQLNKAKPSHFADQIVLYFIPLLNYQRREVANLSLQLLYELLKKDEKKKYFNIMMENGIFDLISEFFQRADPQFINNACILYIALSHICLSYPEDNVYYTTCVRSINYDFLISFLPLNVDGSVLTFLKEKLEEEDEKLIRALKKASTVKYLINCYVESANTCNEDNLEAFTEFVILSEGLLEDLGHDTSFMKTIVMSIRSVNEKQQLSALKLVYRILKIIPDKRRFLTSNNLLNTICSINVTPINSGYVNAFKTIQQSSF